MLLGLIALLPTVVIGYNPRRCLAAAKRCDFRFAGKGLSPFFFLPKKSDVIFTSRIVSTLHEEVVGIANTNGIAAQFLDGNFFSSITNFGNPAYVETAFKTYNAPFYGSGIGHQVLLGNQLAVARGQCVRVYITSYQRLDYIGGNVIGNENDVPRYKNKCVVFRTLG